MSDPQPMIASAVVVPDQAEEENKSTLPQQAAKRRQSSVSSQDSKRPRLSVDAQSPKDGDHRDGSNDRRPARARNGRLEERKRGQRLFGALLGTLSQSSTSATQKRREIEKRQQAKIRQQAQEDDQKKREMLTELNEERRKEQRIFEEQAMRTRHSNMLAMANFFQTRAEPMLYYRPFRLRADEEEAIKQQLGEAEDTIDRELDAHKALRRKEEEEAEEKEQREQHQVQPPESLPKARDDDDHIAAAMEPAAPTEETTTTADPNKVDADVDASEREVSKTTPAEIKDETPMEPQKADDDDDRDLGDDNGEEVLEADEDTVLY